MFDRLTPTNKALILINVGAFALQKLVTAVGVHFALWPPDAASYGYPPFRPWQLLTHGFLHADWLHLFVNMFGLFMFGPDIEELFGRRRYIAYYLTCVVGAALMYLIVVEAANLPPTPAVGASGALFGLLLAYGMAWPKRTVMLLFPPIPMPAWLFVTLFGLFQIYISLTFSAAGVAHLGGMATGFVMIRYWQGQRRRR